MSAIPGRVMLARLAFVHYRHADSTRFEEFTKDFGFERAGESSSARFYRGYGIDQYNIVDEAPTDGQDRFVGAGFCARSEQDFRQACKLEGARLVDVSERPGAGQLVSITDPNGFEIQILFGQEERLSPGVEGLSACGGPHPSSNGAVSKPRKGSFVRLRKGPAMVHKAGHFGYKTENYEQTCSWYTERFNFVPMDILHAPGDETLDVATFFRLDLQKEYVDHHCLLLTRAAEGTAVHHASFEVEDLDTQFMGHQWLQERGYKLVWGIGRHVLGSQVYDYWFDSSEFILEHYADGDIVNEDIKAGRQVAGDASIWGPPLPAVWGN